MSASLGVEGWRRHPFQTRAKAVARERMRQAVTLLFASGETEAARAAKAALDMLPADLPEPPPED